ncbi:MAG TPA: hypothetical protein VGU71_20990 [Candidatus Dormibacteraeota bacterium]|nr:hypothetical protein [Candidatus Dormibacteraeota bacterium]
MPNDFDIELERELHRWLDPLVAAPIPARTVQARGGWMTKLVAGAGAAVAAKMAMGVAIATLAAGVAGVVTEAVITRSLSPVQWSQQVKDQVLALEPQHGTGVNPHPASAPPGAHLAGTANGNGQPPATGQPAQPAAAQPPPESPPSNSVAVPPAESTSSSGDAPPNCAGCKRTQSPAPGANLKVLQGHPMPQEAR